MSEEQSARRQGWLYGLAAYGWWGLVPIYFKAVAHVAPAEVLAHRIVWSFVMLALLVWLAGRGRAVLAALRSTRTMSRLWASTLFIAINWFVYVYGVSTNQVLQTSLGYFIAPLVNVLFGLTFFRERLRPAQWLAVALASAGVLQLILIAGVFPWIALTLACSFGMYALLRKQIDADGVLGLSVETLLLTPLALAYLGLLGSQGKLAAASAGGTTVLLLAAGGVVTTVPLLCFGQAAQRLPMTALGFLQYLSPSVQLVLAVTLYDEVLDPVRLTCFCLIWSALAVFTVDGMIRYRNCLPAAVPEAETAGSGFHHKAETLQQQSQQ